MCSNFKEVRLGLLELKDAENFINSEKEMSIIRHKQNPLLLGKKSLLKVNTNIGVSDANEYDSEKAKLIRLRELPYMPDMMMDHTIVQLDKPLWQFMVDELEIPVGTLPHYLSYKANKGIEKNNLLELIEEMASYGVSFMTLHPTASLDLLEIASTRKTPTTARGGGLIVHDAQINNRDVNIIVDNWDEIMSLFKKYDLTLSIGTTWRPARIDEALDKVHLIEIAKQKEYIDKAKIYGINVIMEGVGHLSVRDIPKYCKLIANHNVPLMPLGPMPTDATTGFDHVTSAIGATIIAMFGNIGSINSVTREEHTGGVPCFDSIIEGLKSARVAAHCINLMRFNNYGELFDSLISNARARNVSCAINAGLFMEKIEYITAKKGCSRCRDECPLTILNKLEVQDEVFV
jgi:phosphomethylpyrimidine synthase